MKSNNQELDPRFRLLISYAHPDDESFGMGGTIAKYVERGVEVSLICSTNGDVGSVDPNFLEGYNSVSELRLDELRCAAETLGIREVIAYGYRDSGMMGTPDNDHPDCLWQADEEVVTSRIVADIRRIRPHVVVTFDPFGGYGHPDHIFMHRATTKAFYLANDPGAYPEQINNGLIPYQPDKLYYSTFPKTALRLRLLIARLQGQDPRRLGKNQDLDLQEAYDRALDGNARINLFSYQGLWDAAAECHASQFNPRQRQSVLDYFQRLAFRYQDFLRVYPEPNGNRHRERDLFEGIKPRE